MISTLQPSQPTSFLNNINNNNNANNNSSIVSAIIPSTVPIVRPTNPQTSTNPTTATVIADAITYNEPRIEYVMGIRQGVNGEEMLLKWSSPTNYHSWEKTAEIEPTLAARLKGSFVPHPICVYKEKRCERCVKAKQKCDLGFPCTSCNKKQYKQSRSANVSEHNTPTQTKPIAQTPPSPLSLVARMAKAQAEAELAALSNLTSNETPSTTTTTTAQLSSSLQRPPTVRRSSLPDIRTLDSAAQQAIHSLAVLAESTIDKEKQATKENADDSSLASTAHSHRASSFASGSSASVPQFTPSSSLYHPVKSEIDSTSHGKKWSDEEMKKFVQALHIFGRDWAKCADFIGSRDYSQVKAKAKRYFKGK